MKIRKRTYEELTKLGSAVLNSKGQEVNNPKPMVDNTGLYRPPSLQEQIQRVLRMNVSQEAMAQGRESFDEANDFDCEDEFDRSEPPSQYQIMEEETLSKPQKPKTTKKKKSNSKQSDAATTLTRDRTSEDRTRNESSGSKDDSKSERSEDSN